MVFKKDIKHKLTGIDYIFAIDKDKRIIFISCDDPKFKIKNTSYIGKKFVDIQKNFPLKQYEGWGDYFDIEKDWKGAFGFTESRQADTSKVKVVFKYKG